MAMNLSVNLNKVALLRNSRGGANPAPRVAAETCIRAGAAGLTLHWREDNRHTRADDVRELCALAQKRGVEFNLEGDGRDELLALTLEILPTQFTLVPVKPGEVTSDHGWDLPAQGETVRTILAPLRLAGIRTAIFVDVDADMTAAAATGAQRIEIYTEPYARAFEQGETAARASFARYADAATRAAARGLDINAGHDLDHVNLVLFRELPHLAEVSIGHALISRAIFNGLDNVVREYLDVLAGRSEGAR